MNHVKTIRCFIGILLAIVLLLTCAACSREQEVIAAAPNQIQELTVARQEEIRANIEDAYTTEQNLTQQPGQLTEDDFPEGTKIMYLTFDDGPSSNTQEILDILDTYDCQATFFVVASGYDNEYQNIVDHGHTLALHTYTHDYETIYQSEEAYFEDLDAIADLVYDLTGVTTNLIRFPGGSSNTVSENYNIGIMSRLAEEVENRGYVYFDWNATNADASTEPYTADELYEFAISYDYEDVIVMLMHDTDYLDTTVECLPRVIEYYKDLGYEFLSLNENSYTAHLEIVN